MPNLVITPGPLPNDHDKVDPATFIEDFIAGTQVSNFGTTSFKGGALHFVHSNTEPPATDALHIGMLWFKRGDGRLYYRDAPDLPSALTFSDVGWVCISDRRELWVYAAEGPIAKGAPVKAYDSSGVSLRTDLLTNTRYTVTADEYTRPIYWVHTHSTASGYSRLSTPWVLVANDSAASGSLFLATELGWCQGLQASGDSGYRSAMVIDDRFPGMFRSIGETPARAVGTCRSVSVSTVPPRRQRASGSGPSTNSWRRSYDNQPDVGAAWRW